MNKPSRDAQNSNRVSTHTSLATELALQSDQALAALLNEATPIGTSIGGTSALIEVHGRKIFVKKIRLTDRERHPQNIMSTRNIFALPLYYQYGIGSTGFGVWRELTTHLMTTHWVLTGECQNFPILYHWRILPEMIHKPTITELEKLEQDVKYWQDSQAVRARLEANLRGSANVVLFLEYIPQNLYQWLGNQLLQGEAVVESACKMVEDHLKETTAFMNSKGLLHFDAHFHNILTDGNRLYFTDFGLALSSEFELSEEEIIFFNHHVNYDRCSTATNFLHCLITHYFGPDKWPAALEEYKEGNSKVLPPSVLSIINRYASVALLMDKFYRSLQKNKQTPYPNKELEDSWIT
ncbi:MAG: protein kinase family protein [Gammaproteobacteria bacterium]|nr:protein kinase family protein [Gammaproteobacteria bacterium]